MTEQDQQGTVAGAPDPAAFNFDSYISGVSTFPEFEHTVYLDQRSGALLHELVQEYDSLSERGKEIMRIQSQMADSPTRSLVDEEAEDMSAELGKIEERTAALAPRINALNEKIRASSLKLVFQAGTAQKLGQVVRQAERAFHKKHGKKDDSDVEYIMSKSKAVLVAQLCAYCTRIVLPDGTEQEPPTEDGFTRLLDSLISSESVRLMTTLNRSLDSSADWAEKIDAGFPGGRDEPGPQSLDHSAAEDGPFLVPAAADAADGGGEQLG